MTPSALRAILFALIGFVAIECQPAPALGQDAVGAEASFATSLDRAFRSDDLTWVPEQNRLLISAKVNDQPAVFKIESGAIGTFLTLKSAKERGLRIIDFKATFTGVGGSGKIFGSPVKRLQLGSSVDLTMQRLAVIELPFLDGIDGVIGGDTLVSTKAIIDYRHKKFRVPQEASIDSLEQIATDSGMIVEKLERDGNYVFANVNYGNEPLRMLVDTGAQRTLIGAATAVRLKMTVKDTDDRAVGAGDNAPTLQETQVDRLVLGKVSFRNIRCGVMPVDFLSSYSKTPIDGILGADALVSSESLLSVADAILVVSSKEIELSSE